MRIIVLMALLVIGCDQLPEAPEKPKQNIMQVVERVQVYGADPDYWILRDSRNGDEYLVVRASGGGIAMTKMTK